jgi:hypothetical protein
MKIRLIKLALETMSPKRSACHFTANLINGISSRKKVLNNGEKEICEIIFEDFQRYCTVTYYLPGANPTSDFTTIK